VATPNITTTANSTQIFDAVTETYKGRLAAGDPLAWAYDPNTYGGIRDNMQTQHVIPEQVFSNKLNVDFFDSLRENTAGVPGGAYVFKANDAQNALLFVN
jgi:hypothetical protein